MASERDPRLQQARDLIKNKNRDQARDLLVEILKDNPNDIDALYMFAHASPNLEESEKALQRLLKIEPDHVQAAAALQKVQQRSVEQLASQLSGSSASSRPATTPKPKAQKQPSARSSGQKRAAQSGGDSSLLSNLLILLLVIVIVVGGVYAFMLYSDSQDSDTGSPTAVVQAPVGQNTPAPTRTPFIVIAGTAPPTWTPAPTSTPAPTRTLAPTSTPHPTRTHIPTLTPTPIEVLDLDLDVSALKRLYNDYKVLIAYVVQAEVPSQFDLLDEAFAALKESVAATNYQDDRRLAREHPDWVEFLDEYVLLLDSATEFSAASKAVLENDSEANLGNLETQRQELIVQNSTTRRSLTSVETSATATAQVMPTATKQSTATLESTVSGTEVETMAATERATSTRAATATESVTETPESAE